VTIATDPVKQHPSPWQIAARDFVQQAVSGRFAADWHLPIPCWGNLRRRQWSINSRSSRGLRHPANLRLSLRWECCWLT